MDFKNITNFWKARSLKYSELSWVNNDLLLKKCVEECVKTYTNKKIDLLDIGAGNGVILKALKDNFKQYFNLFGIDISPDMLIKDSEIVSKVLDIYNLSEHTFNQKFDVILARMVFHHLFDHEKALKIIYKVLKPNGKIIICEGVPPDASTDEFYKTMFALKENRVVIDERNIMNLLHKCGFSSIESKLIVLPECSINNWLDNSGIPKENIKAIKLLHETATPEIKQSYNMKFKNKDILMDWKFIIFTAEYRQQ